MAKIVIKISAKIKNTLINMTNALAISLVIAAIFSISFNVEAIILDPNINNVAPGETMQVEVRSNVVGISTVDNIIVMLQINNGELTNFVAESGFLIVSMGCNSGSAAALFSSETDVVCANYGALSESDIVDDVLLGTMTIVAGTSGNTTVEKMAAVGTTPGNEYRIEVTAVQPTVGAGTNTPTPYNEIRITPDVGTAGNYAIVLSSTGDPTTSPTVNTTVTGLPNTGLTKVKLNSGYLGVLFVLGGIAVSISNKFQAHI